MPSVWFDTHAHVCDSKFDSDRDTVVGTAFNNGVRGFIEIADGPEEWAKAQKLAEQYPGRIWWSAGLHPYYADKASGNLWLDLKKLSKHPQFVAIGEVGIDYAKCPIPAHQQIGALQEALDLASDIDKPLIIHCRSAYADLMPILRERFGNKASDQSPGVIHCFSGNQAEAEELISMGFYLGVDGPLTYPKSDPLRHIFSLVPLERIVIETDSPYLPPQDYRGQRNEPLHIGLIGRRLAQIRAMSAEDVSAALMANSFKLFRLKHTEN